MLALATPAAGEGARLFCMGTGPGFLMTIDGGTAMLDYLGDGRFGFDPPLAPGEITYSRHELVTMRERWDVYLTSRACPLLGAEFDVTVEIAVPTSAGRLPLVGCCTWSGSGGER